MRSETAPKKPQTIHLKDYRPTPYLIDHVHLAFELDARQTRVKSELHFRRNPKAKAMDAALELDGEKIKLVSLQLDGKALGPADFRVTDGKLIIAKVPRKGFTLSVETLCDPAANTALSGLYMSSGVFCTQCEAEGFRRITYFYDRPDVMAKFSVRIEAPKSLPILLSNGNPGETGLIAGTDRHFAEWHDPHPKPSYLFALVAGDLASVHDTFTTSEGRKVNLGIYVEKGKENRCGWAMESLKASMRWDEKVFERAYDLDVFNIVAVSDFNMGAMENKGLNIFNDKYILALPETATDLDYELIEGIIAHEYFHNWTGNRITCRDWFQLCLKEGLTVFRDQEFTSDLRSRAVKRIDDVQDLRARQFPEDMGPLQHAARPASYIEINNFYTATVYEKGAELCRMIKTLIGPVAFDKGMQLYFKRHDGEAATVEDFVACFASASKRDLKPFFRWYTQAGTPILSVDGRYSAKTRTYTLKLAQSTPRPKGQPPKKPLHMPIALGLIGPNGKDMPLVLKSKGKVSQVELSKAKQSFTFTGVAAAPVLSINRGFSAPVVVKHKASPADLLFRMAHDSDSFNRWEAAQVAARDLILAAYAKGTSTKWQAQAQDFAAALGKTIELTELDSAFKAKMLELPVFEDLLPAIKKDVDSDKLFAAREALRKAVAVHNLTVLKSICISTALVGAYSPDADSAGRRALHFGCLSLAALAEANWAAVQAQHEFDAANNMTVEFSALQTGARLGGATGEGMLATFHARHGKDQLLIDKWFAVQALLPGVHSAERVRKLMVHPDFTYKTPNRVYALLRNFIGGNFTGFHAASGAGYALAADAILKLDATNPQVASRLATGFRSWRKFDGPRRKKSEAALKRILAAKGLSRDVYEIISRTLKG
jgi:aminopeptidase N